MQRDQVELPEEAFHDGASSLDPRPKPRPPEEAIRALLAAGDVDRAATEAIRAYGGEVFGFLLALDAGDEDGASEDFSTFCEDLWKGLAAFAWASSLRTWLYAVARNTSRARRRAARRRERRFVGLSSSAIEAAARVRTETLSCLRTARQRQIAELRKGLSADDQTLLVLRVDRDLAWLDLARVFLGEEAASDEALQRESARLRKRFQIVKRRLLELGRQQGLWSERGG
jgi:RNA polymerase sigma-70 factor, ECF subfamily